MIVSLFHGSTWSNPHVKETVFISQYFLQPSIIINGLRLIWEKGWRVCLSEENHGSPAVLKVPIYSTELVAIIFFFQKYCVKCTKALTETHSFMANQHSKFFGGLRAETWPVSRPFLLSTVLFYLKREIGRDRSFIFVTVLSSLRAAAWAIHSIV